VYNEKQKEADQGAAVAIGLWDGRKVLAMRWNGTDSHPKGYPLSSGHATWFIIPEKFRRPILDNLPPESQARVQRFFARP
jgi:hypothetical protein